MRRSSLLMTSRGRRRSSHACLRTAMVFRSARHILQVRCGNLSANAFNCIDQNECTVTQPTCSRDLGGKVDVTRSIDYIADMLRGGGCFEL